jgi:hypothetical protein
MNGASVLTPKYDANLKSVEDWKKLNEKVTSGKLLMLMRRIQCVMSVQ